MFWVKKLFVELYHRRKRRQYPPNTGCCVWPALGTKRPDGAPEKLRLRLYDTPHEFNAEMQAEAWAWLKRWV